MNTGDQLARAIAWRDYWLARERQHRTMALAYIRQAHAALLVPKALRPHSSPTEYTTALELAFSNRELARDMRKRAEDEQETITSLLTREAS